MLINGSNFQSGATVTFHDPQGNSYLRTPTFVSSVQLSNQFDDNSDVGTWTVFVTNPNGQTSSTWSFAVTAAAPSISGLSSTTYPASTNNQTMLINGSNFQSGATLDFIAPAGNSIPSTASKLTFVSSSQISYQFNDGSSGGNWSVTVINPDAQQSSPYSFSVTAAVPAPSVSGVSPSSYPANSNNQTMTINGSNFQSGATLNFVTPAGNTIPSTASKLTFVSSSQISYQFNDGSTAGTWSVTVVNPDGHSLELGELRGDGGGPGPVDQRGFARPRIRRYSNNQTMTINGSNFQSGATLNFVTPAGNTIPSTATKLTFVSSSQISYQFNDGSDGGHLERHGRQPGRAAVSNSVQLHGDGGGAGRRSAGCRRVRTRRAATTRR